MDLVYRRLFIGAVAGMVQPKTRPDAGPAASLKQDPDQQLLAGSKIGLKCCPAQNISYDIISCFSFQM